eukprot:TRINITY_DN21844_c0_g1_i1.p1 TRINITY_DN21844_c0_g1~~TRINITY_DN21844_c0_g1_i1.p1  ORF type:complete len:516 (-),score=84.86 TRINITY_DN21844_c0_g1_i1:99-1625(-)
MVAVLLLCRIPEWSLTVFLSCTEAVLLIASKTRFASFFVGADAQTVFEDPDFLQSSDVLPVSGLSLLIMLYVVVMPVRAKLNMVIVFLVPSVYLALSVPVDGLEGKGSSRILAIAIRLCFLCIVGMMARVRLEYQERLLFFRLAITQKQLIKEKVLRFEAEHEAEQLSSEAHKPKSRAEDNRSEVQSSAGFSTASSHALSSIIFTPAENIDVSLQLKAMRHFAENENWLLDGGDLCFDTSRVLGRGGFGVVLCGKFAAGDVALKVPKKDTFSTSQEVTSAVGREMRTLRNLRHPCIVSFYGAVIDHETQHVVLVEELIDGVSMKEHIRSCEVADATKWTFLYQLISVLEYLHRDYLGIMHGDIKPNNVMITKRSLNIKLIDFGLSLRMKAREAKGAGGSLAYMAPEILVGKRAGFSSDVFSFGRLAYFVATGQDPVSRLDRSEMVEMARKRQLPTLHWLGNSTLVTCCRRLCDACVCVDPAERLSAAGALDEIMSWPFAEASRTTEAL